MTAAPIGVVRAREPTRTYVAPVPDLDESGTSAEEAPAYVVIRSPDISAPAHAAPPEPTGEEAADYARLGAVRHRHLCPPVGLHGVAGEIADEGERGDDVFRPCSSTEIDGGLDRYIPCA